MSHSAVLAASLIVASVAVPFARGDLQKDLRHAYTGKTLSLRIPSNLDVLHFDRGGNGTRVVVGEPWTTCSLFKVRKIGLNFAQRSQGDTDAISVSQQVIPADARLLEFLLTNLISPGCAQLSSVRASD